MKLSLDVSSIERTWKNKLDILKRDIESHNLERMKGLLNPYTESVWVEIPGLKNSLELEACCHPPDQNTEGHFEMQEEIRKKGSPQ